MADKNLASLTAAATLDGTELVYVEQGGNSRKATTQDLANLAGFSGLDFAKNKVGLYMPSGSSATVPPIFGLQAMSVQGSAQARNPATTSYYTRRKRIGYITAASIGAVAGIRQPTAQLTVGDGAGLGGFRFVGHFGNGNALTATTRMFFGLMANVAALTNVEPSTFVNCIGVGVGSGDSTLHLYTGDGAAGTPVNLGANFPFKLFVDTDWYRLELYSEAAVTEEVEWRITNLTTGDTDAGVLTSGIPDSNTLINFNSFISCNASAAQVGLDYGLIAISQDY